MTTFNELYDDWMLPIINDYKIDKLALENREVFNQFMIGFLKLGLSEFECVKSLTYKEERTLNSETFEEETDYIFDEELDNDEKKIIGEIAVAYYWKRLIQDVKARLPYMNQREFKKDALAPIMKENDLHYKELVSEYMADIANYNMKHLDKLPFWEDFT